MPGKGCKKHTPITSKAQRGFVGAEYGRGKAGKKRLAPSFKRADLRSHLMEAKGKKLPARSRKRKGGK